MAYFDQYHVEYSAAPGENKIDLSDRIRGCLVGGAAGDALGYPVEFMTRKQILAQYGSNGMANSGYNYLSIIKHYYVGVEIK